jgi:hypothetical protein
MQTVFELITDPFVWVGASLTIIAWNRGWRGWALLPMAAYYPLLFVIGRLLGAGGLYIDENTAITIAMLFYVGLCLILVAMILIPRGNRRNDELVTTPSFDSKGRFCSSCGKEQQGNPSFCRDCGQRLGTGSF